LKKEHLANGRFTVYFIKSTPPNKLIMGEARYCDSTYAISYGKNKKEVMHGIRKKIVAGGWYGERRRHAVAARKRR
jgi:hypothetical protein